MFSFRKKIISEFSSWHYALIISSFLFLYGVCGMLGSAFLSYYFGIPACYLCIVQRLLAFSIAIPSLLSVILICIKLGIMDFKCLSKKYEDVVVYVIVFLKSLSVVFLISSFCIGAYQISIEMGLVDPPAICKIRPGLGSGEINFLNATRNAHTFFTLKPSISCGIAQYIFGVSVSVLSFSFVSATVSATIGLYLGLITKMSKSQKKSKR